MMTLKVPDMSCGHCASVITKAIKELDKGAGLEFDMHNRKIQVETATPAEELLDAMADAGYPATVVN